MRGIGSGPTKELVTGDGECMPAPTKTVIWIWMSSVHCSHCSRPYTNTNRNMGSLSRLTPRLAACYEARITAGAEAEQCD